MSINIPLALKGSRLFSGLPPSELAMVEKIALPKEHRKEEMIFGEGEPARGFYLLVKGRVKIFRLSPGGKEQIFHIISPGETFAEAAVFSGNYYPAHAQALANSETLFFPKEKFFSLIESHPRLALNMLATLSVFLRQFAQMVEDLSLKEVNSRLASYILNLARSRNIPLSDGTEVELDVSKTQLASRLGTVNESLSRALNKLKGLHLIGIHKKKVTINNVKALEEVASGIKTDSRS